MNLEFMGLTPPDPEEKIADAAQVPGQPTIKTTAPPMELFKVGAFTALGALTIAVAARMILGIRR